MNYSHVNPEAAFIYIIQESVKYRNLNDLFLRASIPVHRFDIVREITPRRELE